MDMLVKPLLPYGYLKLAFNYFKLTEILHRKPQLLASKEIFKGPFLNVYNIHSHYLWFILAAGLELLPIRMFKTLKISSEISKTWKSLSCL
jgi:hypothetical protein